MNDKMLAIKIVFRFDDNGIMNPNLYLKKI